MTSSGPIATTNQVFQHNSLEKESHQAIPSLNRKRRMLMKKLTVIIACTFILLSWIGCSSNQDDPPLQDPTTAENASQTGNASNSENTEITLQDVQRFLATGEENRQSYNTLYYSTFAQGSEGKLYRSQTTINLNTNESAIDYIFVDEDGDEVSVSIYNLLDGYYIYSEKENFIFQMPKQPATNTMLPAASELPTEPLTDDDLFNGIEYLYQSGYEIYADTEEYVFTKHSDDGYIHEIILDSQTGLLTHQTIQSDDVTVVFYDYQYFTSDENKFSLPEGVPIIQSWKQ